MASATLYAMLWPRMPAGERIADLVTWNLFFFESAGAHRTCPASGAEFFFT